MAETNSMVDKNQSFLASEYAPASPEQAAFHIIPVPLERSVSYGGGTARGPAAILEASQQLEEWIYGMTPGEGGFYTAPPVDTGGEPQAVLSRVDGRVSEAMAVSAVPVILGGEHTVTLGALQALVLARERFGIVQFDAHADLRPEYEGDPYSHASVMYRAANDLCLPLVQFAVRDFCRQEADFRQKAGIVHYDAALLERVGLPELPLPDDFPQKIYITFDVDAFDSSLMPATGTPSPGGITWREARFILERCVQGREIIGIDVVELAPVDGMHHANYTAAKLVHLLMGLAWHGRGGGGLQ